PVLRPEAGPPLLSRLDGRCRQRLRVDVPLVRQPGLERDIAAVAVRGLVDVVFHLLDQAERLQVGDDALARRDAVAAAIGRRRVLVARGEAVEDVDARQVVAAADLEVVEVVRGRDLERAGAGFGIGILIRYDGNLAPDQRQYHGLAD